MDELKTPDVQSKRSSIKNARHSLLKMHTESPSLTPKGGSNDQDDEISKLINTPKLKKPATKVKFDNSPALDSPSQASDSDK